MIKPHKHLNPRYSVIHISALILKALKENGILTFGELLAVLTDQVGDKVKEIYLPSLSFLFLTGKLKYHQKIDSFEIINHQSK
jgi:hypothetical protein